MAEFEVKNYDGQVYLKEELKKILNTPCLRVIAATDSALLFATNVSLRRVLRSLQVIELDLKNRILAQKKEERKNGQNPGRYSRRNKKNSRG